MADEKPITIPELVSALKEAGFATKNDVEQIVTKTVQEASDAILEGQSGLYTRLGAVENRLDELKAGQSRLEVGQKHLAEEIDGLKADLSDTVTKKDFNKLKERVERLEERHIN